MFRTFHDLWKGCIHDQIRIDAPLGEDGDAERGLYGKPRVKLYNLQNGRKWIFDHPITYGCKLVAEDGSLPNHYGVHEQTDMVVLHWGLMNHDLRVMHQERWDRIYGKAVEVNPYGFWKLMVETENEPHVCIPNPYI